MIDWKPEFKRYPHFDQYLPEEEIFSIVKTPSRVAANSFFPFISYTKTSQRFSPKEHTGSRKSKERTIRYASRRDASILSYYRFLLVPHYEALLLNYGIQECVLAYRKIPASETSPSGKCNIHFARDVFADIKKRGECIAIALDISQFFESIDHEKLNKIWCSLLGVPELSKDHGAVFKAITQYTCVDRDACYDRLGYISETTINGLKRKAYTMPMAKMPMQLCSPKDFREKICGDSPKYSKLLIPNRNSFGIPQGSPISDLLANMSMINFDKAVNDFAVALNGQYRRYSDDIMFICPLDSNIETVITFIKERLQEAGSQLQIKDQKTIIGAFYSDSGFLKWKPIGKEVKNKPLEYLGFSFDGQKVLLRNSSVSSYYRKMTFGVRCEARKLVARYPGKTPATLASMINMSDLCQKYGQIEEFNPHEQEYSEWNFWTYVKRASFVMGDLGRGILPQLRNNHKKLEELVKQEIQNAYSKSLKKKSTLKVV